jgi:hypothetical protein
MPGIDGVPGQPAAAAPQLDDPPSACQDGLQDRQDPSRAAIRMEPEPEMVHRHQISRVLGTRDSHTRIHSGR